MEFLKSFYSKTGKLNRLQFLGRTMLVHLVLLLLTSLNPFILIILLCAHLYVGFHLIQQRVRSMGWSASRIKIVMWMASMLLPIINLVVFGMLLFIPPKKGLK